MSKPQITAQFKADLTGFRRGVGQMDGEVKSLAGWYRSRLSPLSRTVLRNIPDLAPGKSKVTTQPAGSGLFRSLERHRRRCVGAKGTTELLTVPACRGTCPRIPKTDPDKTDDRCRPA